MCCGSSSRPLAAANRYPDLAASGLVAAIARRFDVPVEHVAVGTGSVGVCQQIVQATAGPGDEVVFAWRSFEAYPIIVQVSGATAARIPLRADETHDLDAMAAAITDRHTRCVFVCNPNNPTGAVSRRAELEKFLDAVPADVLVVLDEAYREFVRDPDVPDGLDLYRDRPNVCVLRTFSKAYGLAALRVGFADRARAGRGGAAQDRRAVRRLDHRPGGGGRLAAPRRMSCGRGSRRSSPSGRDCGTGWSRPGWTVP